MTAPKPHNPNWDKRPGYINGEPVIGYDEVSLHHVANLIDDLWGDRPKRAPRKRLYVGIPGKWREQKRVRLKYSLPYYRWLVTKECGWHVNTGEAFDRGMWS